MWRCECGRRSSLCPKGPAKIGSCYLRLSRAVVHLCMWDGVGRGGTGQGRAGLGGAGQPHPKTEEVGVSVWTVGGGIKPLKAWGGGLGGAC